MPAPKGMNSRLAHERRLAIVDQTAHKAKTPGFQGFCHAAEWSRTITPR